MALKIGIYTRIPKVYWATFYVCRSCRGKTGRVVLFAPHPEKTLINLYNCTLFKITVTFYYFSTFLILPPKAVARRCSVKELL